MTHLTRKLAPASTLCGLALSLALPLAVLSGCFTQQARQRALAPALSNTLPRVEQYATASPDCDTAVLARFSQAVRDQRYPDALILWPSVRAWAEGGIAAMVADNRIGPVGANERRETLNQYEADLRRASK